MCGLNPAAGCGIRSEREYGSVEPFSIRRTRKRFLRRCAVNVQELAYGGLKPETIKRLEAIAEDLDGGDPARRRRPANDRPIAGTRLIREYQGVEHCVTVRDEDFEYQGRPYKSLSAVACAITGTQWNGLVFFGLKNSAEPLMKKPVVRKLRCAVYTRKSSEEGLDMEFNSLDAQREACEAYVASQKAEGWLLVPDRYDDGGFSGGTLERPALQRLIADIEANRVDVVVAQAPLRHRFIHRRCERLDVGEEGARWGLADRQEMRFHRAFDECGKTLRQ